MPQLIVKYQVFGSLTESGHDSSYSQTAKNYFSFSQLKKNVWETLIDSKHYGEEGVARPALLQVAPWLWLAPIGMLIMLLSTRYPLGIKLFVIISSLLIIFYLSGANMSAQKLQFHCLRYISPGFIVLNLGVVVLVREIWLLSAAFFSKLTKRKSS